MKTSTSQHSMLIFLAVAILTISTYLLLFPSFEWNQNARLSLSENEQSEILSLNREFGIHQAIDIKNNTLLGKTPDLPLSANVLLRNQTPQQTSEMLVETQSGNILLLQSKTPEISPQMIQAYTTLDSVTIAEKNSEGHLFTFPKTSSPHTNKKPPSTPELSPPQSPAQNTKVRIAVIDSGIDFDHPAFADCLWNNTAERNGLKNVDDDQNGFTDDITGWDFAHHSSQNTDNIGHGTHVSGIISAGHTSLESMEGINPSGTEIMVLKVADHDTGLKLSHVLSALTYAQENEVDVVNMSFGFPERSEMLHNKIKDMKQSGISFIAAAGNSSGQDLFYPAAYQEVISVGSSHIDGRKWQTSTFGESVDIFVPGYFLSTLPHQNYGGKSGTSQASALVTGMYSFFRSEFPEKSPEHIELAVKQYGSQFEPHLLWSKPTLEWAHNAAQILDQKRLPSEQEHLQLKNHRRITRAEMFAFFESFFSETPSALQSMSVRKYLSFSHILSPQELSQKWNHDFFSSPYDENGQTYISHLTKSVSDKPVKKSDVDFIALGLSMFHAQGTHHTPSPASEHPRYISRGEFLEYFFHIFVDTEDKETGSNS